MGGWLDRLRAWWNDQTYGSEAGQASAFVELDRRRKLAPPKPFCDCPYDEDFGHRLHEDGCPVTEWYNNEAKRRRLYGL